MPNALLTAIMASLPLPLSGEGTGAPDWVHLLPPGDAILTRDGRGPYRVADAAALMAASLAGGEPLVIDQDHATDLAAPKGEPAPARGWIVELAARESGLWGRVEWTAEGRALVEGRAYRGLSPVFLHSEAGQVLRLLRASLTNTPNLRGLTALHAEQGQDMDDLKKIAEALGLPATATVEDVIAKIKELGEKPALQSALTEIGAALGVSADKAVIVAAATAAKAGTTDVVSLQSQVTSLQGQLAAIEAQRKRDASERYVDAEMAKGRHGLNAKNRETFVALHMEKPDEAKAIIEGLNILGPGAPPPNRQNKPNPDGTVALNAEQLAAATALGIAPAEFLKTLKAEEAA